MFALYREIGNTWQRVFHEKSGDILARAIQLRKGPTMERLERPSRLDRARMLGYKAKEGVVVVRIRVGAGGMRRQRPTSGRRPKHLGVLRMKSDESVQKVAERRVREKHVNLKLLGSYLLWVDGKHRWYEMVLIDPLHPAIKKDYDYRRRIGLAS
jgi:large subunit ribosomal protein L15e